MSDENSTEKVKDDLVQPSVTGNETDFGRSCSEGETIYRSH